MTEFILYFNCKELIMKDYFTCDVIYLNGLKRTYHSMIGTDYSVFLSNVFSSFLSDDFELPLSSIEFKTVNC